MDAKEFQQKKDSVAHKVGDSIERLGQKISNAGAPKIGKMVTDAGDKIEHMNDEEVTSTPSTKPVI